MASHRLKRAGLQSWMEALAARTTQRRKEALADRWRARRDKRAFLSAWRSKTRDVRQMESQADVLLVQRDTRLLAQSVKVWMLAERGALLKRVSTGNCLRSAFETWRRRHATLVVSLQQREVQLTASLDASVLARVFGQWSRLADLHRATLELAARRDARLVLARTWSTWSQRFGAVRVREERAAIVGEYICIRGAFRAWTVQMRERRLAGVLERSDRRTTSKALSSECSVAPGLHLLTPSSLARAHGGARPRACGGGVHARTSSGAHDAGGP